MSLIYKNSIGNHLTFNSESLLVILSLFLSVSMFAQMQIGQDINGTITNEQFGTATSMSVDGKRVVIGASNGDGNGYKSGHASVLEEINGSWVQIGLNINGEAIQDHSGQSVSMSANGKRVAIGAPSNDGNGIGSGQVRIYEEVNGNWIQVGQDIDGEWETDKSGFSVSISASGSRVLIGAIGNFGNGWNAGQARVYEEVNGNWIQIGQDIDGEAEEDRSGFSVSISANGSRVAIGAIRNDNSNGINAGHTRVYQEVNGIWTQIGQDIDGKAAYSSSGNSVSISADGTIVAIGAPNYMSIGHAKVYRETNGVWTQIGQDIDGQPNMVRFGYYVSISDDGTTLAVSAPNYDGFTPRRGRTMIYELQNEAWVKIGLDIYGENLDDSGNASISGDGTRVAIGAPLNDYTATNAGHTRIYEINNGALYSNYLTGNVIHDLNLNCSIDTSESGLQNWFLQAKGANGTIYALTDSSGYYQINVDSGTYDLTITPPNYLWQTCTSLHTVHVSSNDNITTDFSVNGIECPNLVVGISTPLLRRCVPNTYIVSYSNNGLAEATNAFVELEFPAYMNVNSSSIPWNSQIGNTYSFSLDTIPIGTTGSFSLSATPICNATVFGQTICVEAHIYPDSICVPADTSWEGSITTLDVACQQDSVTFTIKNTGSGDMLTPIEYFVIQDDLIMKQGIFQLYSMDSLLVKVPSNGSTYRIYAGQSPGHFPPAYLPTIAIEGCGVNSSGTFSTGFITMFPERDLTAQVSMDCQEIRGSYDPNDKQAVPKGYGTKHYIEVGDDLDYKIRFQNVGNDTAFQVIVLDTISPHLNIASFKRGASSHPYQLEIVDGNILKFTFHNIQLVDSTANEPESHGFLTFKISQAPNLPLGTIIYNSSGIYFDYNEPVITNQTYHELGEDFIQQYTPCSDLTTTSYILPGTVSELSTIEVAIKISEINNVDTENKPITVRMPSDPRLFFTWDVGLTSAAFLPVQNSDWNYLGDNGLFHTWEFNKGAVMPGGSSYAFGLRTFFDPQSTDGTTTFSATITPFSGGECNVSNNVDVEQLVYFD